MKKKLILILSILLIGIDLGAQTNITGIITNSLNKPIPFANVYILSTSLETTSDKDGKYAIRITQNGNYQLFASYPGFETNGLNISVEGGSLVANIQLFPSSGRFSQFEIEASEQYKLKYYGLFLKLFLGETTNADYCKIMNPNVLYLIRVPKTNVIKGCSTRPLRIENRKLGYTIVYNLKDFSFNLRSGLFKLVGNYYFIPYKGNSRKFKYWNRNRLGVYTGSRMHFIRSLYSESLEKEHFEIYESDSIDKHIRVKYLKPLDYSNIITHYDQISKTFYYKKQLTVVYNDPHSKIINASSEYETNYYKSYLSFADSVHIFQNGTYDPFLSLKWEGEMLNARVADMLPYDYWPESAHKK